MPVPSGKALVTEIPLREASVQYKNQLYVADEIFPIIGTSDPKLKVPVYAKGAWFRDEAEIREPGSRAKRGSYPVSTVSIATKEFAFAKEVTDEDVRFANATSGLPLQPEVDAISFCADKIDLSKERRIAALCKATAFGGGSAGGEDVAGLWAPNDTTNTFLEDVFTRKETIRGLTGVYPNTLMVTANTWAKLIQIDAIVNRIRYVAFGVLDEQNLAKILGIERVLVAGAIYSSAKEKKDGSDFTAVNVWENNATKGAAFLFYKHPTVGLKVPLVGVQVRLNQDGGVGRRTSYWREEAEHQTVYEVAEETDFVVTGADLGFWWNDTILT